jgi:hypothetical protein
VADFSGVFPEVPADGESLAQNQFGEDVVALREPPTRPTAKSRPLCP